MTDKDVIYGYMDNSPSWREVPKLPGEAEGDLRMRVDAIVGHLLAQGATGLFLLTKTIEPQEAMLAEALHRAKLDLIVGFEEYPEGEYRLNDGKTRADYAPIDKDRMHRATDLSYKLAVACNRNIEWGMQPGVAELACRYRDMAMDYGYQWVCTVGHGEVLDDIKLHVLRGALDGIMCVSLCCHVYMGYLYADPRVPNQDFGWQPGHDLNTECGLTIENLREYVRPLKILSGAGGQTGLDAGTRRYARRLGFNGLVVGMPFDLSHSLTVPVNDEPDEYPTALGTFDSGYRVPQGVTWKA